MKYVFSWRCCRAAVGLLVGVVVLLSARSASAVCSGPEELCRALDVGPMWLIVHDFDRGDRVRLEMRNMVATAPSGFPDPELYVLALENPASESDGAVDVLAFSDDKGTGPRFDPLAPAIEFDAPYTGAYTIVVVSQRQTFAGEGVLDVSVDGTRIQSLNASWASVARNSEFRSGDSFMITKATADPSNQPRPTYANPHVLVVDQTLASDCANASCDDVLAQYNDNDMQTLSRVDIVDRSQPADGRVYFGTRIPGVQMHARRIHVRRSVFEGGRWRGPMHRDHDRDGLTVELERDLGTCEDFLVTSLTDDSRIRILAGGASCEATQAFIDQGQDCNLRPGVQDGDDRTCWSAADSDHDGLSDFEEIYGTRRCYRAEPEPILGDVPACNRFDEVLGVHLPPPQCSNECTGASEFELALSAVDGEDPNDEWRPPDPRHFDALLTLYYGETPLQNGPLSYSRRLGDLQIRQMLYTFEEEPTECNDCAPSTCENCVSHGDFCRLGDCCDDPATDCPDDMRYEPRLHIFQEPNAIWYEPNDAVTSNQKGAEDAAARFNFAMRRGENPVLARRRYTHTHRFGNASAGGGGGQAQAPGRNFIFGTDGPIPGFTATHESIHNFGVHHDGGEGDNNDRVTYPSLMSCAYGGGEQPLKARGWDGMVDTCNRPADCDNNGTADDDHKLPERCNTRGQCPTGRICADDDFCRIACVENSDCPVGERCGVVGGDDVCVLQNTQDHYFNCVTVQFPRLGPLPPRAVDACLPRVRPLDRATQIWPYRLSRGVLPTLNEASDAFETGWPISWYLHYMGPQNTRDCYSGRGDNESYNSFRGQRVIRRGGQPRGACTDDVCQLDINRNVFIEDSIEPYDVNENDGIQDDDQADFDDWGQILRRGHFDLLDDVTYDDAPVFMTGFNPSWGRLAADYFCTGLCELTIAPFNVMGWQPTVIEGAALDYRRLYDGAFGYWARFTAGPESFIELEDGRLEALVDSVDDVRYLGMTVAMWLQIDVAPPGRRYGLLDSGALRLWLRFLGGRQSVLIVSVRDIDGNWVDHRFGLIRWDRDTQRYLRVEVRPFGKETRIRVLFSDPLAGVTDNGGPARDAHIDNVGGSVRDIVIPRTAQDTPVGAITLGRVQVDGETLSLNGWMDDLLLMRGGFRLPGSFE